MNESLEKPYKVRPCLFCGYEPKNEPTKDGTCYHCGKRGFKEVYAKGELPEKNTNKVWLWII